MQLLLGGAMMRHVLTGRTYRIWEAWAHKQKAWPLISCVNLFLFLVIFLLVQATLAAANVAARLRNKPVYNKPDILPFVEGPLEEMPSASPSIVNAEQLGLSIMS